MDIYARRFLGFTAAEHQAASFTTQEARDRLLEISGPGTLVAIAGSQEESTSLQHRGRLLGLVEIARIPTLLCDLIDVGDLPAFHFGADGSLAFPVALPVLRAWAFDEPFLRLGDALKEQLTFDAIDRPVRLDDDDAQVVLAIPKTEIQPPYEALRRRADILANTYRTGNTTTGPRPSDWTTQVSHDPNSEAWTYLMRFGTRDVWKVGYAQDVEQRLSELNQHVPHEALGEQWSLCLRRRWTNSFEAYAMEQALLNLLAPHRTEGERVRCAEEIVNIAWTRFVSNVSETMAFS